MIDDYIIEIFINQGVLGVLVVWFMFRMEKVIKNNTEVLYATKEVIKNERRKK